MTEVSRISDQLKRAFEGDAWHGPSLMELLDGLSAGVAAVRPIGEIHSIWEIVNHVGAWERIALMRLHGRMLEGPSDEEDWPRVIDASDAAWQQTLKALETGNRALREEISLLDDEKLEEPLPVLKYPIYYLLHGIIQHDLYHAGQIALLKKLVQ